MDAHRTSRSATRIRRTTLAAALLSAIACGVAASSSATFHGTNGLLVFERPVGKQVDLFTVQPDGSELRRLTRTAAWEEKAEWSPDGRRLTFARSEPSGDPTEIATMAADGTDLRVLTHFGSTSQAPTWSPDGRIAYFTLRDFPHPKDVPPAELYSMRADGTGQRRLTDDRQIQTDAEWSPDGRTIAFSQWRAVPGEQGVFDIGLGLMNSDASHLRSLLAPAQHRDIATQSWSPDGKRIVFELISAHPSGRKPGSRQSDIAVINVDGTGLRRLTHTAALETEPVWSPDGTTIAFASDRQVKGKRELDRNGPAFEIYTMKTDGSDIRRLTNNNVPDLYPDWQPLP
jgi:TolB protein